MKGTFLLLSMVFTTCFASAQNVGIGTNNPAYKLDVAGELRTTSNAYLGSYVGIGTTSPSYKLQVNDGSIAIFNSSDVKTWYFNYNASSNYFQLAENGIARMVVANGGNIGIGTTAPSAKLDVVGNAEVSGDAAVGGALTVQGGKGVLYNLSNSSPVKHYTRAAAFSITNLGAHQLSAEGAIGFIGGFAQAPSVFVGDITAVSGTGLYQMQLIIYDVTTTGCKCRLLNTSNSTISQNCTWNITCIGY